MQVSVITTTCNPLDTVSFAAGVCYGKRDPKHSRARACMERGHMSVFEHASATLLIDGISRACMAQLTRHRLCSFCVESQRYCKYDLSDDEWYVKPPAFDASGKYFDKCMRDAASHYAVNIRGGMKPEDARYLLPEATKTSMVMTCNVRQLFHIFDMRDDSAAQWEIRELVRAIADALRGNSDQWDELIGMYYDSRR